MEPTRGANEVELARPPEMAQARAPPPPSPGRQVDPHLDEPPAEVRYRVIFVHSTGSGPPPTRLRFVLRVEDTKLTRRSREDGPGSWHHVMNRGMSRRPMFEDRHDIRFFLSRVAREVRRGTLEVHAWCVLMNHYHMFVRSPAGELSEGMRRIQRDASRSYNRRHRRDGALVRGRFLSKPVDSDLYATTLVRYIDFNAVRAGIVEKPWDYPWSSAAQYVNGAGPLWLRRSWVEREVAAEFVAGSSFAERYCDRFGRPPTNGACRVVEHRANAVHATDDDLDHLYRAAPDRVAARMRSRAARADGGSLGLAVSDAATILAVVAEAQEMQPDDARRAGGGRLDPYFAAAIGLLRGIGGARWDDIARHTGRSRTSCHRAHAVHLDRMRDDSEYGELIGRLGRRSIVRCFEGSAPMRATATPGSGRN